MEEVIQGTEMRGVGLFMYILKLSRIMTGIIWMIVTVIPRQKSLKNCLGGPSGWKGMKAAILFCFSFKSKSVLQLLSHTETGFISSP